MTRPDITKGNIVWYLGSLWRTAQGGFKNLIAHTNGESPFNTVGPGFPEISIQLPPRTPLRLELGERY
jgi:hypothetical protein